MQNILYDKLIQYDLDFFFFQLIAISSQVKCTNTLAGQSHGSLALNSQILLTVWSGCSLFICLQRLEDQCLLSVQHIPLGGYSAYRMQFGLSLCPRSVLLSGSRDTVVWCGEWCNTGHMGVA